MKYLITSKEVDQDILSKLPIDISHKSLDDYNLFTDEQNNVVQRESFVGITDGYIRNLNLNISSIEKHTADCIENIVQKWPLPENITGSFTCLIINKANGELILCNDLIGLYPVYYCKSGDNITISNSIILMALFSGQDLDDVGILQRSIGQDFSSIGTRTILKTRSRLV